MDVSEFSPPTRRWLEAGRHVVVDGLRVFVHEPDSSTAGREQSPAILLLHGFPTSCYDWRGVIEALCSEHRCLTFDFPGYGLSDKPVAYSYSLFQQTDIAEKVARELGVGEAHVISHDVGQTVHAELLAREREGRLSFQIRSSTILNGSTLQDLATVTSFQKLLASNETLPQAIAACENLSISYVEALKALMKRPEAISDDDAVVMQELLLYQNGHRRIPALAGYMRERLIHRDRWLGALKDAQSPMQIVWADGDPVANVKMGRALSGELPQAFYIELPELGHFLIMEDPGTVAKHVLKFISGVAS